jgi:iron(III) transport system substrate-binding protein
MRFERPGMTGVIAPSRRMALKLIGLAVAGGAAAQNAPARRPDKTVRVVSTTDTSEVDTLLAAWQALHPDIAVAYERRHSTNIYNEVLQTANTGRAPDVVWSSAMDLQLKLVNDGFAQRHSTSEAAALPPWAVWNNEAFGVTAEPVAIVYNKQLLRDDQAPQSHADLTKLLRAEPETYKGKIATYDPEQSGTGFLFLTYDVQTTRTTWDLVRAMGRAGVKLYASSIAILDRVAAGDAIIGYNVIASYAMRRAQDDPSIGVILPSDYTLHMTRIAIIPKAAAHPDLGGMFLDFMLSAQGQRRLDKRFLGPVRADVPADISRVSRNASSSVPIPVGPELLAYLDQAKRARFLREWRRSLEGR